MGDIAEYKEAYGRNPPQNISNDCVDRQLNHIYEMAERIEPIGYQSHPYEEEIVNIRNFVKRYAKTVGYTIRKAMRGSYFDEVITDILNENYPHWQIETVINPRTDNVSMKAVWIPNSEGRSELFVIPEYITHEERKDYPMKIKRELKTKFLEQMKRIIPHL